MTETTPTPDTAVPPETEPIVPVPKEQPDFVVAVLGAPGAGTSLLIRGLIEAGTALERFVPLEEPVDDFAGMMDGGSPPETTRSMSVYPHHTKVRGRHRPWFQELQRIFSTKATARRFVLSDLPGSLLFPPPGTRPDRDACAHSWNQLRRADAVIVCIDAADTDSGVLCRRHLGRLASMMFTRNAHGSTPRLVLVLTKTDTWAADVLDAREAAGCRQLPDGRLVEETSPHDLARRVCAQTRATALLGSDVLGKLAEAVEPDGDFAITAASSIGFCPYSGRPVWTGTPVKLAAETLVDRRSFAMRELADFVWDGTRNAPLHLWTPPTTTALGPAIP